jgi:glycerol dehydrogenase-like iron-containing ADH family enzyme
VPDQLTRGFDSHGALRQAEAFGLLIKDAAAESLALLGIGHSYPESAACHAHAPRRDTDTPAFRRT